MVAVLSLVLAALVANPVSAPRPTWSCTYKDFGKPAQTVTSSYVIKDGKLVLEPEGVPTYDILENNEYALIATEHFAELDRGGVRVFSSTVIIEKKSGRFIYMIGEIGNEPGHRTGRCKSGYE